MTSTATVVDLTHLTRVQRAVLPLSADVAEVIAEEQVHPAPGHAAYGHHHRPDRDCPGRGLQPAGKENTRRRERPIIAKAPSWGWEVTNSDREGIDVQPLHRSEPGTAAR